jgi:hypothetical protein
VDRGGEDFTSMKNLLSLFDHSGVWSEPFAESGEWNVIQWDIKLSEFMDIHSIDSAETALDLFEHVNGIIGGPPCTDFTKSGAQYWSAKDSDGRTWKSVQVVNQFMKLVDLFRPTDPDYDDVFFWCLENPAGRIQKLIPELETISGHKGYFFHPYEFAHWGDLCIKDIGRLDSIRSKNGKDVTKFQSEFVMQSGAYKKQTGLWGEFNRNMEKRPIEPVRVCAQGSPIQRTGGKSDKTKEDRSVTPIGFARAFYEANKDHRIII